MFWPAIFSLLLLEPPVLERIEIKDLFAEKNKRVMIKDLAGNELQWNQFKGKVAVVNIWATWCPYCVEELPNMARFYKKFAGNNDVVFIFFSDESHLKLKKFNDKNKLGIPICYSKSGKFPLKEDNDRRHGGSIPVTYIIAKDGQEIYYCLGSADWDSDKATELINELLKK